MFTLKTSKVVGTPNGAAWSQGHLFSPTSTESQEKRGQLLVVVSLRGSEEGLTIESGREILSRLNEEYYGNLEPVSPFLALRQTLEKVSRETQSEITAAVFFKNAVYLSMVGKGRIVVKRGSFLQTLLEGAEKEVKITSGFVKAGDLFLLGTEQFFSLVAQGTLRAALETGEPAGAVEILAPIVAGREEVGAAAAAIAKVVTEEEREEQEVVVEEKTSEALPKERLPLTIVRKIISRFPRNFLHSRPVFLLHRENNQGKRLLFSIAAVLIFLLLASVILGIRKREADREAARLNQICQTAQAKLEEGKALVSFQPNKAREILGEAKRLIEMQRCRDAEMQRCRDAEMQRCRDLQAEIERELAKTIREYKLEQLGLFFDLNLVKEGATGERLNLAGGQLLVLDRSGRRLLGVDLQTKAAAILAGGEGFAQAVAVAGEDKKAYTLTPEGILLSEGGKTTLFIKRSESWGEIADLKTYGGNLYLLDKSIQTIWRYPGAKNWLGKAQPELAQALSLAVDGSIYVLVDKSPWILRFASGRQDAFSLTGFDKPPASPTRLFTNETLKNIYILDKGNYRIAVLDKKGNYQASYLWAGMGEVQDLVASEENKKMFLLAGSKIYEILQK